MEILRILSIIFLAIFELIFIRISFEDDSENALLVILGAFIMLLIPLIYIILN